MRPSPMQCTFWCLAHATPIKSDLVVAYISSSELKAMHNQSYTLTGVTREFFPDSESY